MPVLKIEFPALIFPNIRVGSVRFNELNRDKLPTKVVTKENPVSHNDYYLFEIKS